MQLIKKSLSLFLLVFLITICKAQQFPIYTQYMFDPYLINPSMVGMTRKSEVNLLYRQQWTGFDNGPKTIQFDYQHAIDNRMAFGVNIFDDKSILLSSTSVMATFGYKVPLASEHIIGFGLSGGFFSNRIKIEDIPDIDANDPAILNSRANNFSFDGQFGVNYNFRNLYVGFSLIRLIDHKTFSEDALQNIKFGELKNKVIFASYKFRLSDQISLQPNFSYRFTTDNLNFYETSAIFSFKDLIGVGGGYRESFGPTALVRLNIKDLQVGYAYDFPSNQYSVSTGGSNEIQLKWRFGKIMDRPTKKEKITTSSVVEEPVIKVEEKTEITPVIVQPEPAPVLVEPTIKPKDEPAIKAKDEPMIKPKDEPAIKAKDEPVIKAIEEPIKPNEEIFAAPSVEPTTNEFLLILGSFNKRSNADKLARELSKAGYKTEVLKSPGSEYYYVHLPAYKTDSVTLEKVLELRKNNLFKDAWFKKME